MVCKRCLTLLLLIFIEMFKILGYVKIAKNLLMHEADISAKTNNNQTAILLAIQNGIN